MRCNITALVLWGAQRGAWNSTSPLFSSKWKNEYGPPEVTTKDLCLLPTQPDCEWVNSCVPGAITKQILKLNEIEVKHGYLSGNAGTQGVYACRVTETLLSSSVGFCSFLTQRWGNWVFKRLLFHFQAFCQALTTLYKSISHRAHLLTLHQVIGKAPCSDQVVFNQRALDQPLWIQHIWWNRRTGKRRISHTVHWGKPHTTTSGLWPEGVKPVAFSLKPFIKAGICFA